MKLREKIMEIVFLLIASISIIAVFLICYYLFAEGIPAINEIGWKEFLLGKEWRPGNSKFGIFPMIVGSIYVTLGAVIVGVPIGLLMAIFMSMFCPDNIHRFLKPVVDLLAGIPSIIYGFFGLVIVVPYVRDHFDSRGFSIFTASIILGIMILPTIISVSESALRAVPAQYHEGALALGATSEISAFKVVLPAAKSGVMAAIVLAIGRAIGETMAVQMIVGNQARLPDSIFEGVRTMTTNIVLEMGYATDLHRGALIGTGVILFIFILIINLTMQLIKRRQGS